MITPAASQIQRPEAVRENCMYMRTETTLIPFLAM